MLVDRLFTPQALETFAEGRARTILSAEHRGLYADNFILIGSVALALNGLHVYPSDVDCIQIPPFWRRNDAGRAAYSLFNWAAGRKESRQLDIEPSGDAPLSVTILRGPWAEEFVTTSMRYYSFKDLINDRRKVGNLATVPPERAALAKSKRGAVKDTRALIQAHAGADGCDIVNNSYWQEAVAISVSRAMYLATNVAPDIFGLDSWLSELVKNEFEHPAFAGDHFREAVEIGKDRKTSMLNW